MRRIPVAIVVLFSLIFSVWANAETGFDLPMGGVSNKLVVVDCGTGSDRQSFNGFIARMEGKSYLFTSQRILFGAEKIAFKTVSGKRLRPRNVELSTSCDIARLLLADETEGFEITDEIPMNSPSCVLVHSASNEAVARLFGKVVGVGGDRVEVSARFASENSGAPVLNSDGMVFGIASYVQEPRQHAMKKGTKFGSRPRRFCCRLANARWQPVNWRKYNHEYGSIYRANKNLAEEIDELVSFLGDAPKKQVRLQHDQGRDLELWVTSHNRIVKKYNNPERDKQAVASEYAGSIKRLSRICGTHTQQIQACLDRGGLTRFLREELELLLDSLSFSAKFLNFIGDNARDFR